MDYNTWHINEYSKDSRQGNKFAPAWPFRMIISGSSDSGKTTMIMNLLMGNKNIKEDGERYVLCNDVILIGKHLDEPKWVIVRDFYNELAEEGEDVSFQAMSPDDIPEVEEFDPTRSTVVVFEDLMNMPKNVQERISDYFSSGRHSNISPIYVSQRFFKIPKTIRENITHISLHRGAGSLLDTKRIISQYTDHSDDLAPVIDDLTRKKEFIIFDLGRSRDDPLSIRVRWDTSLRSIIDHPNSIIDHPSSVNVVSSSKPIKLEEFHRFSSYGQNVITQAKKDNSLVELARDMPTPSERQKILAKGVSTKNSDIWARYVFREAYDIKDQNLGPEWVEFSRQIKNPSIKSKITKDSQLKRYQELLASRPLNDKKILEGLEILLWFFTNKFINQKTYISGINEIMYDHTSNDPRPTSS